MDDVTLRLPKGLNSLRAAALPAAKVSQRFRWFIAGRGGFETHLRCISTVLPVPYHLKWKGSGDEYLVEAYLAP